jgi:hypothetical protein
MTTAPATPLTDDQKAVYKRLKDDLPFFTRNCIKIATKSDGVQPLVLNPAQQYLHAEIEQQRAKTGKVRVVLLKARQQGATTYIEARGLHKSITRQGHRTLIMAHDGDATTNIYQMARAMYDNLPKDPIIKPATTSNSSKELDFAGLGSSYRVATAGKRSGAGRGQTVHFLHASELAFYEDAKAIMLAAFNTVPEARDTEIIIESTANGVGGAFYELWQRSVRGISGYKAIFIPWFMSPEYQKQPPAGWYPPPDNPHNLTPAQLYWRQEKINFFNGEEWQFNQEYPSTPEDAFQLGKGGFIPTPLIMRASVDKHDPTYQYFPVLMGIDPAGEGKDHTGIVIRQGLRVLHTERMNKTNVQQICYRVRKLVTEHNVYRMYVDATGIGYALLTWLQAQGFSQEVIPVHAGGAADEGYRYQNKRTEMIHRVREWLQNENACIGKDTILISDLSMYQAGLPKADGQFTMRPKKEMPVSPDMGDALCLTFAYLININARIERPQARQSPTNFMSY